MKNNEKLPELALMFSCLIGVTFGLYRLGVAGETTASYANARSSSSPGGATKERPRVPPPPPRVENLKSSQSSRPTVDGQTSDRATGGLPLSQGTAETTDRHSTGQTENLPLQDGTARPPSSMTQQSRPTTPLPAASLSHGPIDVVEVKLEASGKLGDPKASPIDLSLGAQATYEEQILAAGDGVTRPIQAIRAYKDAAATILIDGEKTQSSLLPDRRFIGVFVSEGECQLFSPKVPLTREELDLLTVPANSAVLDQLLPSEPVRQGLEWELSNEAVVLLLGLDSLSSQTLRCRITESLPGGLVQAEVSGNVRGRVLGATTQIQLLARFQFQPTARKVTWFGAVLREARSAGYVDHAFQVSTRIQVTRSPVAESTDLASYSDEPIMFPPLPENLRLVDRNVSKGWELLYDRRWYIVKPGDDLTIFRMVDRRGQIAQCNLAVMAPRDVTLTLAGFREGVQQSLGEHFQRVLEQDELTSPTGHRMFRVHLAGRVENLPIHWIYYLIATPEGPIYITAFTVEETALDRFNDADRQFVDGLSFLKPSETAKISAKANPVPR